MLEGLDPATIIALCALMSVLWTVMGFIVNMLLAPVRADVKEMQKGQARIEKEFRDGQARLENKLDLLLKAKA